MPLIDDCYQDWEIAVVQVPRIPTQGGRRERAEGGREEGRDQARWERRRGAAEAECEMCELD